MSYPDISDAEEAVLDAALRLVQVEFDTPDAEDALFALEEAARKLAAERGLKVRP